MKTKVCLFVRVSTDQQDYQRQISDLTKLAEKNNYEIVETIAEKISGAKSNSERKGINELVEKAKAGKFQKVLVTEISRIGRSPKDVIETIDFLTELKISVMIQDMGIETLDNNGNTSFLSEMLVHIASLFSKNERTVLKSRIVSGMRAAKLNGIHIGRPAGTLETEEEFLKKYNKVVKCLHSGLSVRQICILYSLSQNTVMKVRKAIQLYKAAA